MTPTMMASSTAITTAPMIIRPVTSNRGSNWSATGVLLMVSPKSPWTAPESQCQYRTKKLSFSPNCSAIWSKNTGGGVGLREQYLLSGTKLAAQRRKTSNELTSNTRTDARIRRIVKKNMRSPYAESGSHPGWNDQAATSDERRRTQCTDGHVPVIGGRPRRHGDPRKTAAPGESPGAAAAVSGAAEATPYRWCRWRSAVPGDSPVVRVELSAAG